MTPGLISSTTGVGTCAGTLQMQLQVRGMNIQHLLGHECMVQQGPQWMVAALTTVLMEVRMAAHMVHWTV